MTVVIGVIYDDGVAMISDRFNVLEDEGYSQIVSKIKCQDNFCMGFAGTGGFEEEFINAVTDSENWMDAFERIKRKYSEIRWRMAVEQILKPIGCESLEDLKIIGDTEIVGYYLQELKNFDPDLKILIGIYDGGPHLCAVGNPGTGGCFDDVGFYAIGAGEKEATIMLNFLGFRKDFNQEKAILFAYLAKKASEVSVKVDGNTDIFVINERGWRRVDEKIYDKKYLEIIKKLHKWRW